MRHLVEISIISKKEHNYYTTVVDFARQRTTGRMHYYAIGSNLTSICHFVQDQSIKIVTWMFNFFFFLIGDQTISHFDFRNHNRLRRKD